VSSLEQLHRALANRYHLERELGRDGMATTSIADGIKHKHDFDLHHKRTMFVR